MDVAALIVSILAIIIAAWALVYSHSQAESARSQAKSKRDLADIEQQRHARELAEREALLEASKVADLDVTLEPPVRNANRALTISNRGPARASAVTVELVPNSGSAPAFVTGAQRISVPSLPQGGRESVTLLIDHDDPVSAFFDAVLRWTDPRGPQESRTRLSLWQ